MAIKDQNDLLLSTDSPEIAAQYDQAITELSFFRDPTPVIEPMLAEAPHFVMGQVLAAYLYLLSTDEADAQVARNHLDMALSAASQQQLNAREQGHLSALEQWLEGSMERASDTLDRLLIEYPQDMLALLIGHQLDFFRGDATNLKNRIARALPGWDKEHPLYGFVLGMYGFGLEEAREYERAEQVARQAVELNPKDVWGIHAVAHALEMLNRYKEGATYMADRRGDWAENNFFIPHNALHLGLFKLEMGELDEIMRLSDALIHNADTAANPIVLLDGSSLIWRLYLDKADFGQQRAERLANSWREKMGQNFYVFNDVHAIMAFIAAGDFVAVEQIIQSQQNFLRNVPEDSTYHRMTREVGLPLSQALYDFGCGRYQDAVNKLMPIRNIIHHFGGSHAQRDAFSRTLLESACRAGDKSLATALLGERLGERPNSPYNQMKGAAISLM